MAPVPAPLEREIFPRVAERPNADVQAQFDDTTSLRFEIDRSARGFGEDEIGRGLLAVGCEPCAAPRRHGLARNAGDAPARRQLAEPTQDAAKCLKSLQIELPTQVLHRA